MTNQSGKAISASSYRFSSRVVRVLHDERAEDAALPQRPGVDIGGDLADVDQVRYDQPDLAFGDREHDDGHGRRGRCGRGRDQALDPQQRQRAAAVLQDLLTADQRDLVAADPFEARDQLHRNRELLVRMIPQDQRRLRLLRFRLPCVPGCSCSWPDIFRFMCVAMPVTSRIGATRAVAQHRGAGQAGALLDVSSQRLDDDFLGVGDTIDHQAVTQRGGLDDDDVDRLLARRLSGVVSVAPIDRASSQPHQGQQDAAEPEHLGVLDVLDPFGRLRPPGSAPAR